jgi:hypothetical protein
MTQLLYDGDLGTQHFMRGGVGQAFEVDDLDGYGFLCLVIYGYLFRR